MTDQDFVTYYRGFPVPNVFMHNHINVRTAFKAGVDAVLDAPETTAAPEPETNTDVYSMGNRDKCATYVWHVLAGEPLFWQEDRYESSQYSTEELRNDSVIQHLGRIYVEPATFHA